MESFFAMRKAQTSAGPQLKNRGGIALVITLMLVSALVLILVVFVSVTKLDYQASASYSKAMDADQLARAELNLVVAQLQMEMSKDALPDTGGGTYTNSLVYTNITSANILPQGVGTNADIPTLVKMSTNAPFFTGTLASSPLQASTISTATTSQNGRSIGTNRWQQSYFGNFSSTKEAPYWVLVTRSGPTNAVGIGFGASGNTVNNAAASNNNYAIGRFGYAIYNEGGLLDVNAAGTPSSITLTAAQQDQIKGMLAGTDLSKIGGITTNLLTQWRNTSSGSGASLTSYTNSLFGYPLTNAAGNVYPGDTAFLSRQDLINAALAGQAGLTTGALTNLTTFTRELNRPSWAPSVTSPSIAYSTNANAVIAAPFSTASPNPNPLVPLIRAINANSGYLAYHDDGSTYSDAISAGDPVVRRRFSLARLAWLGPGGAATINGSTVTAAAIQACFGLVYAANKANALNSANIPAGAMVWQYVGPTGTTEQSSIETLTQVAAESPSREPNFFELLQAGILSGSLATDGGQSTGGLFTDIPQKYSVFQILRIGANIICQYNTDQYPRVIEYSPSAGTWWLAAGVQNLPFVNSWWPIMGQSPDDPNIANYTTQPMHYAALEYLFGLWNPHQQNQGMTYHRPPIRICMETGPTTSTGLGCTDRLTFPQAAPYISILGAYGYQSKIPVHSVYAQLSTGASQGANGFLNPGFLTSSDVASGFPSFSSGTSAGANCATAAAFPSSPSAPGGWTSLSLTAGTTLYTYRMPDLQLKLNQYTSPPNYNPLSVYANLQVVLEYQDTKGNWIPYDYWSGINDTLTWQQSANDDCSSANILGVSLTGTYTAMDSLSVNILNRQPAGHFLTSDPRTFRFNPWECDAHLGNVAPYAVMDSLWSGLSLPGYYAVSGYGGGNENSPAIPSYSSPGQAYPKNIAAGAWYFPAYLCRNNSSSVTAPASTYTDPDGVQRIGDSGLFPLNLGSLASAGASAPNTGNPFWTSATPSVYAANQVVADRPIILNRAFNHVADLGYAFRDDPWRSLDFFSAYNNTSTSADSGLLDLFSVREEPSLLAGRVDLNTQNIPVLLSVLNQTVADVEGSAYFAGGRGGTANSAMTPMSSTAVTAIATQLAAFTKVTPLVNKDQLVTQFGPKLASAAFGSTDEQSVKACREAFVRTLADVGQTRTWNLMVDLVAQAGRYPSSATGLDQFVVESERRYWLHIAIDRFTGKVIDQKLEAVSE